MLDSTNAGDIDAVREHTTELIQDAAKEDQPVLIEAPPGSGKTTTATGLALETDRPITYLAGRIDLYEQAAVVNRQT
jgi:superfamily II DNA or RNA helicase